MRVVARLAVSLLLSSIIVTAPGLAASGAAVGATGAVRVSLSTGGVEGNDYSYRPAIPADGRLVAFQSAATNLVSGDANGVNDIFVHDRNTGQTSRVSVATGGGEANGQSYTPSISADGRYVAFESRAGNLVGADANSQTDIFLHDRATGQTVRASTANGGGEGDGSSMWAALSADGRYLAFASQARNLIEWESERLSQVYLYEVAGGQLTKISTPLPGLANGASYRPAVSGDGRFIAFHSDGTGLVGNDGNGVTDVFVHDRQSGQTTLVSVASGDAQANGASMNASISADGRYVAFESSASNLVAGDTNGQSDVFVRDRDTGVTLLASAGLNGAVANGRSSAADISADGQMVAFTSLADNLAPGDSIGVADIFVRDLGRNLTTKATVAADGGVANGTSGDAVLAGSGAFLALWSEASNLVAGDNNNAWDVFVYPLGQSDTVPPVTTVATSGPAGESGWYRGSVTVRLTADDGPGGSGVKEIVYSLSGAQTAQAVVAGSVAEFAVGSEGRTTATYFSRDVAGNEEKARSLDIGIDKTKPTIALVRPAPGSVYLLGQPVKAEFSCADLVSGIAKCTGSVASGQPLDTSSVGLKGFTVTANDAAGNVVEKVVEYSVTYAVCPVSEHGKPAKAGATTQVTLRLCDAAGSNRSSQTLRLTAIGLLPKGSSGMPAAPDSPGKGKADDAFRYDASQQAYTYSLSTKNVASGTWELRFKVEGDPRPHAVEFTLR